MTPNDFTVGQELFVVHTEHTGRRHTTETMTVTKIGRKWVTLGKDWKQIRFDPANRMLCDNDCGRPSQVFLSEADYSEQKRKAVMWEKFKRRSELRGAPASVSAGRLAEILSELGYGELTR